MTPRTAITPTFKSAHRINKSLTASLEKQALHYLAHHTPQWLTSDHLTTLGLLAQIAAGIAYAVAHTHPLALLIVNAGILLNWLGDSLDGTLARVRSQQRPRYGFYVDHMSDLLGSVALMTGLGLSGFVHWPVTGAMLLGFLLLAAESYLATYTLAKFQLSQGLFGPTEIRILLCIGNLALLRSPYAHIAGHRLLLFDLGGMIAATFMLGGFLLTGLRHTAQLYREEPLAAAAQPGCPIHDDSFTVGMSGPAREPAR